MKTTLRNRSASRVAFRRIIQENRLLHKKEMQELLESRRESEERRKETEEQIRKSRRESEERQKETEEQIRKSRQESEERQKEHEERMRKYAEEREKEAAEREKRIEEARKQSEKTDAKLKSLGIQLGNISANNGKFAEEYFENVFEEDKTFAGIKFDSFHPNMKSCIKDCEGEYDLVLINGKSVAIIETKYNAHPNDVDKIVEDAAKFRILFPYYKKHNIYLGLASLSFCKEIMEKAKEKGIAIIRQKGGKTEVFDRDLKVY